MKIIFKLHFPKGFDIAYFLAGVFGFWYALRAFESGELQFRSIELLQEASPFGFFLGISFILLISVVSIFLSVLIDDIKLKSDSNS